MPMDKEKNVRRGFIFVTYETVAAAEAAAKKPKQIIGGKECDVKKATPRSVNNDGTCTILCINNGCIRTCLCI